MTQMRSAALAAALVALIAGPAAAAETGAKTAYDRMFVSGTLDALPQSRTLIYDVETRNGFDPDAPADGRIELSIDGDMARLTLRRDGKHRVLGEFPAGVGNPIIMYFVETVVRDVAAAAGGSPFYIRNRMKEALLETGEVHDVSLSIEGGRAEATEVVLHPFEGDPNAARMQGFDALTVSAIMSPDVPGLYQELNASVPDGAGAGYSTALTFDRLGERAQGEDAE